MKNQNLYTKTKGLRFRKTPNTTNLRNLIRELNHGQKLELVDGPWFKVRIGRTEGWVHGDYITEKAPASIKSKKGKKEKDVSAINFQKGVPNLERDATTKAVRKAIDDIFNLGKAKKDYALQCTEYVQYRLKEKLNINIKWPQTWGRHGGNWGRIFKKHNKYNVLAKPEVNCAVCFTEVRGKDGTLTKEGHVAFVERVSPSGTISISEANWPRNGIYGERPIPKWKWQNQYKAEFVKFI